MYVMEKGERDDESGLQGVGHKTQTEYRVGIGDAIRETASRTLQLPPTRRQAVFDALRREGGHIRLILWLCRWRGSPRKATRSWRRMVESSQAPKGRNLHRAVMGVVRVTISLCISGDELTCNSASVLMVANSSSTIVKVAGPSPRLHSASLNGEGHTYRGGLSTPNRYCQMALRLSDPDLRGPVAGKHQERKGRSEKSPRTSSGGASTRSGQWRGCEFLGKMLILQIAICLIRKASSMSLANKLQKSSFRKNEDLTGVEVVFGKGHWKPAVEFLGYSYGSGALKASPFLFYHNIVDSIVSHGPSYRKFYIPHHRHSLRWKRSGVHYACTTKTVKVPVAVLEPAMQRAPPQMKILDFLFRLGSSKPQCMHNGLPLMTAMLLVTPNEEWMNVTRTSPSDSFLDNGSPSDLSLGVLSSNGLPSSSSLSSGTPDMAALLHTSEATPEIDRWRSSIPARAKDDNHAESGGAASEASSRVTSRLSSHTDNHAAVQHSAYTSGQGVYATHSGSSLSLASHPPPSSWQPNRRTRELPRLSPSQGYSYTRGAPSTSSHRRVSQDEPPPLPPLPTSAHTSQHDRPSPISPVSVPPRRTPASPTSSIHTRSLPVPPTPLSAKPPIPPLPIMPSRSSPASSDPVPGSSTPPHPPPPRSLILHPSSECFLLPGVATRLQLTHQTATKLLREYARSIPFTNSGPGPDRTRRVWTDL
ncbi:hypothetical protein EDB83DRAFT_2320152 [Lactarius deliciosus]|nr:hypothetical protein EDB83DRAFT_2320152 [Lactarius deliciosus]